MAFDMLVGSEALRARLASDIRMHALSHAYLIEGAVGSGRRTLATALAAALACRATDAELPCGACPACRKVLEGKSPDVIRITRGSKASIGVDEVRFLRADVLVPPNDLDNKVYIIEDADTLTVQAQNALLLTLEEPPPYVLFLLLCTSATGLLETIRSRAALLRLEPVRQAAMEAHLREKSAAFRGLGAEEQQQILLLSDGSIGRALALCDAKERQPLIERRALAARYVAAALGRLDATTQLALLSDMGITPQRVTAKRDELVGLLLDVTAALRDLVLLKRSDEVVLRFYTDREAALSLCERVPLQTLLSLCDAVEATRRQLLRNVNVRLAMTSLLFLA